MNIVPIDCNQIKLNLFFFFFRTCSNHHMVSKNYKASTSSVECHLDSSTIRFTVKPPLLPKPKNIELKTSPYKVKYEFPSAKLLENETNEKTFNFSLNKIACCDLQKTVDNKVTKKLKNDSDVNSNTSHLKGSDNIECILKCNVIDNENNNYSLKNKYTDSEKDFEFLYESELSNELDLSVSQINNMEINSDDEKLSIASDFDDQSSSVRQKILNWFGSFGKGKYVKPNKISSLYESSIGDGNSDNDTDSQSSLDNKPNEQVHIEEPLPVDSIETKNTPIKAKSIKIVEELISTEKVFIDVLNLLCKTFISYVEEIRSDIKFIPSYFDLLKIISPLPQLLSLNEELLQDMEKRVKNWSNHPKIADVIVKKGPFLKLYSTYIQQFEDQCNFLDECCQKYPLFQKCVKDFEASDVCKKLTIKHYMLKPIQRIPQYRLLLENYLKNQNEDSIDYKDTQLALKIVCDVANHANKSMQRGVSNY